MSSTPGGSLNDGDDTQMEDVPLDDNNSNTVTQDNESNSTTTTTNEGEKEAGEDKKNEGKKKGRRKKKKAQEEPKEELDWRVRVPVPCEGGPLEEKKLIKETDWERVKVKKGETYYIISAKWLNSWRDYVNYDDDQDEECPRPGPIVNDHLIRPDTKESIRKEFSEGKHYEILPENAWNYLVTWYGGGPPLARSTIPSSSWSDHYVVEVRPLNLKIVKSSQMDVEHPITVSKTLKVKDLQKKVCKLLGLKRKNVRIWDFHARNKIKLLLNVDEQLDEASIIDNQLVLFEEKDAKGNWPAYQTYSRYNAYSEPSEPGIVGLNNLGNTCFMNSSLQCLSNTPPLVNFFLTGQFKSDLNKTNPLGMKGELAEEYCNLLKELWSGASRATAPRNFKHKLEHFAPQFSGYQQHDSQELLGFLLDGLHEDLNRVLKKPYIETKDSAGRPDEEVSEEAWNDHRARNDSVIVDYFQGQLKSTLVCPECAKISITFDPFMYLSLPLPMKTTRDIYVYINYADSTKVPLKIKCTVFLYGTVADLRKAISEITNIPPEAMIITDVYDSRFFREFKDSDGLDMIQDRDFIYANEVPLTLPPYPPTEAGAATETEATTQTTENTNDSNDNNNKPEASEQQATAEQQPTEGLPGEEGAQTGGEASATTNVEEGGQDTTGQANTSKTKDEGEKEGDDDDDWDTSTNDNDYPDYYYQSHSKKMVISSKPTLEPDAIVYLPVLHRRDELIQYRTYYRTPTTYTRKSLFGNPLIVAVRRNITYKDLYRTILSKLSRYVRLPEPEVVAQENAGAETETTVPAAEEPATQEGGATVDASASQGEEKETVEEKKDEPATTEASTQQGEGEGEKGQEGEAKNTEAEEQEGSDEGEVNGSDNETSSSSSSSSSSEEEEEEYQDARYAPIDGRAPLFILRAVDNFGLNDQWVMENDDQPLMLDPKQCIAIVWTEEAIAAGFYDKDEEEKLDVHPSAEEKEVETEEKPVTLQDCIELFTQTEKLGPEDPWYCNRCQEFRQATKKFDLWRLPKILVVHLKRFSYKNKYWRDKLETYVDYPEDNLDLSPYVLNKTEVAPLYELYAVSNHYGSLGGGHYTAYAKNHRNGKWYGFDDSHVSEASTSKIHSSAAYVLFYRRKDVPAEEWVQLSVDEAKRKARGDAGEETAEEEKKDEEQEKEAENDSDSSSSSSSSSSSDEDDDDDDDDDGGNDGDEEGGSTPGSNNAGHASTADPHEEAEEGGGTTGGDSVKLANNPSKHGDGLL